MTLLDHHHEPLANVLQWNAFHQAWLTLIAFDMNAFLPPDWYAEPGSRFGIEVDVAALERMHDAETNGFGHDWKPTWSAPAATATIPFAVATDEEEVRVYGDPGDGMRLVGAVELVSPANKDRPEYRQNFVSKCHGYLQDGVGLVLVDTVTSRHFNLHNDLLDHLGHAGERIDGHLYATAYRPMGANGSGSLDLWLHPLTITGELPTVPLWLNGGISVPVRLPDTYADTCRHLRIAERLGRPTRESRTTN